MTFEAVYQRAARGTSLYISRDVFKTYTNAGPAANPYKGSKKNFLNHQSTAKQKKKKTPLNNRKNDMKYDMTWGSYDGIFQHSPPRPLLFYMEIYISNFVTGFRYIYMCCCPRIWYKLLLLGGALMLCAPSRPFYFTWRFIFLTLWRWRPDIEVAHSLRRYAALGMTSLRPCIPLRWRPNIEVAHSFRRYATLGMTS